MSRSALNAIKAHCKECCGDMPVSDCNCTECNLWKFRFGKDPDIAGRTMSEEQKARASETLRRYRENSKK